MDIIDVLLASKLAGSGGSYDDAELRELIALKLNKQYGAQYAGYALVVGSDGNVGAGDIISTSKVAVTSEGATGHVTLSFIET